MIYQKKLGQKTVFSVGLIVALAIVALLTMQTSASDFAIDDPADDGVANLHIYLTAFLTQDNDEFDFVITGTGTANGTVSLTETVSLEGGFGGVWLSVPAGTYTIAELLPDDWVQAYAKCRVLDGATSETLIDYMSPTDVPIGVGQEVECHFINAFPGTGESSLTINNTTDTGDLDVFTFDIALDGAPFAAETVTVFNGAGSTTLSDIPMGTYTIVEQSSSDWTVNSASCTAETPDWVAPFELNDPDEGEGIVILPGWDVTCEFVHTAVTNNEQPPSIEFINLYDGQYSSIFVDGDLAYLGGMDEFTILDISDPTMPLVIDVHSIFTVYTPEELGVNSGTWVTDIEVLDGKAYLTHSSNGLFIFDVSDPITSALLGHIDPDGNPDGYDENEYALGNASAVHIVGNIAYVADRHNGMVTIDVSDPFNPTLLNTYGAVTSNFPFGQEGEPVEDVAVVGNIAFVSKGAEGLHILDVSDPAQPTLLNEHFYNESATPYDIEISGNIAYVYDVMVGIVMLDISDPAAPVFIGIATESIEVSAFTVVNDLIYVTHTGGLSVIDVTNMSNTAAIVAPEFANGIAVVGETIYVTGEASPSQNTSGLYIYGSTSGNNSPSTPENTPTPPPTPTEPTDSSATPVPTMTPTPSPTSMLPTAVPTSTPIPDGDGYENDDVCGEARPISPDDTSQLHTFNEFGDVDWIEFEAVDGVMYQIVAEAVGSSAADLVAEVYADCNIAFQAEQSHSFAPSVILNVTARQDGMYKVKFYNDDPAVFGDNVEYRVSVTEVTEPNVGAVVIVGGRDQADDHLQDNIHDVTNRVYKMFAQNGYSESRIHYLATDFAPNGDPDVVVDGAATAANLQDIITNQLFNQVSDQQPLTIYMMSHGFATGGFYLDEVNNERILPEQLDSWLDELQANRPGLQINIIIDACYAGQFISNSLGDTISGEDRVVITSSANNELAWSSFNGANFSDYFLVGIHQRKTIYEAYEAARWAVSSGQTVQHAWIDDDGDGVPNSFGDGNVAAERYLLSPDGSFGTTWEPYIESVVVDGMASVATIQARVLSDPDGLGIETVQAVLYPPSFEPDVDGDRLLTTEGLPTVELTLNDNGWYVGSIPLDEMGEYEVSVHAQGNAPANLDVSLQARPSIQTFSNNRDSIIPLAVDHVDTTLKSPLFALGAIVIVFSTFTVITPRLLKQQD